MILSVLLLIAIALIIFLVSALLSLRRKVNETTKTLTAVRRIYRLILEDLDFDSVVQKTANSIPEELKFGTGVVSIYDERTRTIRRISASVTSQAQNAVKTLNASIKKPFNKIEISIDDPNNLMAKALRERKIFTTPDVYDVLGPVLTREEAAKIQEIMGTKTTFVLPIFLKNKPIGVFLASTQKKQENVTEYEMNIITDFMNTIGVIIYNSKLYTSLQETTESLNEANTKLKALDKLKDDFVSIASHELRTPMTAIRSYSWMALNRPDVVLSEKMKKYLSRTLISTERLINLVNDMLNISRIESGRIEVLPKQFDIQQLVQDVFSEVDVKAKEKNLHLKLTNSQLPLVFADQDKVHQVLLNLIGNALKFTPVEGTIEVSFFCDGQIVEVLVKDTGVGITQENISKLFEKFGRLENSYVMAATTGGTGLGLYISKSLVNLMGGKIWAKSGGLNKGSTFIFTLPVANKEVLANAAKYTIKLGDQAKPLEPVSI